MPQKANAQEWLKDRRYQEGIGVRTGDFELHPGIAAEIGYDSNWFLRTFKQDAARIANGDPNAPVQDGAILRITPSLNFSTLGGQRRAGDPESAKPTVTFRGGLSATYREFFGPERLRDQRNVSATANMRLDVLPDRPIGFGVEGSYTRTIQPNTTGDPDQSFNRDDLDGRLELVTVPGGGTLDWRFGYGLHATLFENSSAVPYNNITNEAYTKGRWKFRPRTAFLYDGSVRWRNYLSDADRATVQLFDSTPVRARLGLNGLITSRFAFLGMVGWGSSFNRPANLPQVKQYNSVIGQAEFKFFLTAAPGDADMGVSLLLSSIAIGYSRDFQPSYLGSHYGSDRGYAKVQYMFAGRVLLSLEGGVGALTYPDLYYPPGATQTGIAHDAWTDVRADATLFAEYRFSSSFGVNTTFNYTTNISDTRLPIATIPGATAGTGDLYDLNYRRFQAFLGVRWFL